MITRQLISGFLAQHKLALVGVSRGGKKFGNAVFKELSAKGYEVFLVHPEAQAIGGQPCWPSIRELPEKVGGLVVVVPPAETEKVVREAVEAQIPRVWLQQGSESAAAIRYCEENGVEVVFGQCLLMFLEPTAFFHHAHRWLWQLLGKAPH